MFIFIASNEDIEVVKHLNLLALGRAALTDRLGKDMEGQESVGSKNIPAC